MRKLQRTAFLCAAVCMCTGAFAALPEPCAVYASEELVFEGMKYEESGGEITVTGYTADLPEELVIPAEIDGKLVTRIGAYAFSDSKLVSVTIPEHVTEIGNNGFTFSRSLRSVTLPEGIEKCGIYVFSQTPWLNARRSDAPFFVEKGVLIGYDDGSDVTEVVIPDVVRCIAGGAFRVFQCMEKVTIPDSVTYIGPNAFDSCTALESVVIPDSVTEIGDYAFSEDCQLKSITLPKKMRVLGQSVFSDCRKLESAMIPDGISEIKRMMFKGCLNLARIQLPDSVKRIDEMAFFGCEVLREVKLPAQLAFLGECAFSCCYELQSVTFPETLAEIGEQIFYSCNELTEVTVPAGTRSVGKETFCYCRGLKKVTFLNPGCVLYDAPTTVSNQREGGFDGVIAGYSGSEAELYAEKYGYPFESLGEAPVPVCGDLTGDGTVTAEDAQLALQAYVRMLTGKQDGLSAYRRAAADVNSDAQLTAADPQIILQYYVKHLAGKEITWEALLRQAVRTEEPAS